MNFELQQFMGPRPPDIEAICRECGHKIAEGEIPYRSLDVYDTDPEPYCPGCESGDLEFLKPREDR